MSDATHLNRSPSDGENSDTTAETAPCTPPQYSPPSVAQGQQGMALDPSASMVYDPQQRSWQQPCGYATYAYAPSYGQYGPGPSQAWSASGSAPSAPVGNYVCFVPVPGSGMQAQMPPQRGPPGAPMAASMAWKQEGAPYAWREDGQQPREYQPQREYQPRGYQQREPMARKPCKYGSDCTRRDESHQMRFAHPGDEDYQAFLLDNRKPVQWQRPQPQEPWGQSQDCDQDSLSVESDEKRKKKRREVPPALDDEITLMVRNIPNKYTPQAFLEEIWAWRTHFTFFYLPIDFKNRCNLGYAFVNFSSRAAATKFADQLDGQKLPLFEKSEKVLVVQPARVQGLGANVKRFRNSSVMGVLPEEAKPMLFKDGEPQPFPMPGKKLPPVGPRFRPNP